MFTRKIRRAVVVCCAPFFYTSLAYSDVYISSPNTVRLAPLHFNLKVDETIGISGRGLICFPSGRLLWAQLEKPSHEQLEGRLELSLRNNNIYTLIAPISPVFPREEADYVLAGHVTQLRLSTCAPGFTFGKARRKVKAKGRISIDWEVWSVADRKSVKRRSIETQIEFDGVDPRISPELLTEAIVKSANDILSSSN